MLRYAIQRLAQLVPTLVIITFLVFGLIHLIPGDPVAVMLGYSGDDARALFSSEVYQNARRRLGLDDPIPVQYLNWLGRASRGDLGESLQSGQPVREIIFSRYPATLQLAAAAFILGLVVAIPAGVLAAVRQNTWLDYLTSGFSILGVCIPSFWLALLLVLLFSLQLDWLPSMGYTSPTEDAVGFLQSVSMPAVVLALGMAAHIVRFLRSDVLEQLRQDYVRTARSKGIPQPRIVWRHVLRNSLITTVTVIGFEVGALLGGSTVVEVVFAWPGVSYLLLQSIYARDYPIVQGVVLLLALTVVLVNFIVDVFYRVLDPRIRLA